MRFRCKVGLPPVLIDTPARAFPEMSFSSSVPRPSVWTRTPPVLPSRIRLLRSVGFAPPLISTPARALPKMSFPSSVPSPPSYTQTPLDLPSWI